MIPDVSNACWRQLVTGQKVIQTQALALQMLLKRLQRNINAGSPEADIKAAELEMHAFFIKYQNILANEIKAL